MSGDKKHTSVTFYWVFCFILCGITFMEWCVFKKRVEWGISSHVMVPALLGLSAIKFVMVVGWWRRVHNS